VLVMMQCFIPNRLSLKKMDAHHILIASAIDDVIPLEHKKFVKSNVPFKKAFFQLIRYSSLVLSVSGSAAESIKNYVQNKNMRSQHQIEYACFYSGCDFQEQAKSLSAEDEVKYNSMRGKKFIFSVGTLEPRKGYWQSIRAFEQLWSNGFDVAFVIVGKEVWKDNLAPFIQSNSEYGKHLFWFPGASDALLAYLYQNSLFVLNASQAEGFGLSPFEATFYCKPVLSRDLPVFKELLSDQVRYFSSDDSLFLASMIEHCVIDVENGRFKVADKKKIAYYGWEECANKFWEALTKVK